MANLIKEALRGIKGVEVRYDLSFRDLTTIKVGGPIGATLFVKEVESLHRLMERLEDHSIPWLVLGKGSNLLASDRGFDGVVLILTGQMTSFRRDGTKLVAGAGLGLKRLMGTLIREGISGLEFLVGIPGTVGGAVAVNAGAFGKEIKDVLTQVELLS
ncbi:MAG: FAD-binding protein, partial [Desulfatiglandales bacterium]